MSERVYSFELCKNISAKEAVELSEKDFTLFHRIMMNYML